MARRFNNQQSGSFYAPVQVNDPYTSQQYQDAVGALNQAFGQSYNSGSFQARHPVASKLGLALMGGLLGAASGAPSDQAGITGALGAVVAPMIGGRIERNRQAGVDDQYQNQLRTLGEMERNLLPSRQSYGRTGNLVRTLEKMGFDGEIPIDPNAPISSGDLKTFLDGGSATLHKPPDFQGIISGFQPPGFQGSPSPMGQAPAVTSSGNMEPAGLDTDPALNPAQLEASATKQEPRDYVYTNPALVKADEDNVRAVYQTLIQTYPEYAKLPYQQQLLVAQTLVQKQMAEYRNAQTQGQKIQNQFRPQYEKARIGKLNYRTPVRPAQISAENQLLGLLSPEQKKQAAIKKFLQSGGGSGGGRGSDAEMLQKILDQQSGAGGGLVEDPNAEAAAFLAKKR